MQHDEVIWQCLAHSFCGFKAKTQQQNFCRNPYNVTGLCSRKACPLANSKYATIREKKGKIYLYIKTIERAHTPANMWEKIKLPKNFSEALQKIDEHLQYFPKFLMFKNKQRLTKITQYLVRMRKLKLKAGTQPKLVRVNKKRERQLTRREYKAEMAAQLDKTIEEELLARLREGKYPDEILNFPQKEYESALDRTNFTTDKDNDEEDDINNVQEFVEADSEEEENEEDQFELSKMLDDDDDLEELERFNYSDDDVGVGDSDTDSESDSDSDSEVDSDSEAEKSGKKPGQKRKSTQKRKSKKAKRPHVEIEYEKESESIAN